MSPKVLTADELRAMPRLSIIWTEYWDSELKSAEPFMLAAMKCRDGSFIDEEGNSFVDFEKDMAPDQFDGSRFRFWDAEPTEEQRKAVQWK